MLQVLSVENMRNSDRQAIAAGTPSLELMRRAGLAIYMAGASRVDWEGPVAILSGPGNNGGDGYALACAMSAQGLEPTVFQAFGSTSADGAFYRTQAIRRGIAICDRAPEAAELSGKAVIVDCLLGTGFHGTLGQPARGIVEQINASGAMVVSADINSGLSGNTGWSTLAVRSDLTVAIGAMKTGMLQGDSRRYIAGSLVVADIGIEPAEDENELLSPKDYRTMLDRFGLAPGTRSLNANVTLFDRGAKAADGVVAAAMKYVSQTANALVRVSGGPSDFFVYGGTAYFKNPGWVVEEPVRVR